MYSVNEIYELMKYIINKDQNGYLSPAEFNNNINFAQNSYISFLLGTLQMYVPGRPISRVELGQNTVVRQRLTPSIYEYNLAVDSTGYSPYPGDFLQVDAMWSIYGYNRIRWTDQDKWYSTYNSVIDPVATNPIYRIKDIGLQFAPENIGAAKMSYVRVPPAIIWGYTLDVNGIEVYDPATSQDPIWENTSMLEILSRALRMSGVNLQSADVSNYAEQIKAAGQ
jgi:hypothetical protein